MADENATPVELDELTKDELLEHAQELGLNVPSKATKDEIRAAIDAQAEASGDSEGPEASEEEAQEPAALTIPRSETRNSADPQHFPNFPGLYLVGQPAQVTASTGDEAVLTALEDLPLEERARGRRVVSEPRPIRRVDESELPPGTPIPLDAVNQHVASQAPGEATLAEDEVPQMSGPAPEEGR